MEAMRQSWTDDRLDVLNEKVDRRLDEVDRHFDEVDRRFDEVDRRFDQADRETQRRFDEVNRRLDGTDERLSVLQTELRTGVTERLDSIQRSMIYLAVGLTTGMLAGFGGMATLLAVLV